MRDLGIIHCIDISRGLPAVDSDILYSRLFGQGEHNLYQFDDTELLQIDRRIQEKSREETYLTFHGARMYRDAARLKVYKKSGTFPNVTKATGLASLRSILEEEVKFPVTKSELIEKQGWKVFDLAETEHVHVSTLLEKLPDREYRDIEEVMEALKGISIMKHKIISCVMKEYDKIGEERMEWYDIKYWFDYFGLNGYKKLLNSYKNEISFYPEVQQTLEEISENYMLIVSSNSPREFLELELEKFKRFFHRIFSAPSDFRQVKTIDFYQTICDILEIKPGEMVHVGDHWLYDFIFPGRIGIHSFYLDRKWEKQNEYTVNNLKEFKIRLKKLEEKLC